MYYFTLKMDQSDVGGGLYQKIRKELIHYGYIKCERWSFRDAPMSKPT